MKLFVYRDTPVTKELVGTIEYVQGEYARFSYDKTYLDQAMQNRESGISEQLPLASTPYTDREITPFFSGLLPEGEVFENLLSAYQTARNDYFTLLDKLGYESIGALTFVSESSQEKPFASYEPLDKTLIERAIANPSRLATNFAMETRLSLAGAQSKVAWFLPENKSAQEAAISDWLTPRGTAPSSHIIKISRKGEEDLAYNEAACAELAISCGFSTAKVNLMPEIPGAIAIERYDRVWIENTEGDETKRNLMRLHQEDFCQALGLMPMYKYQPTDIQTEYIMNMADLISETVANPAAEKRELAKRLVFNYLIGNTDAHLKNYSLLYDARWKTRTLAPMYDLTCIPLSGYSTQMPFDFGKHRALEDIDADDILTIALDVDVSMDDFENDMSQLIDLFETTNIQNVDSNTRQMANQIVENSKPRLKVIKSFLGK